MSAQQWLEFATPTATTQGTLHRLSYILKNLGVSAMKPRSILAALLLAFAASAIEAAAQTPPPAPALVEPASGAALVQPMTLRWSAVVDPDGPIGSYTWQVGTSSTFGTIIAAGATNLSLD